MPSIDVVLEIMKDALSSVKDAINVLDNKALFIAASATAIVALVAPSLTNFSPFIGITYLVTYLLVLAFSCGVYRPQHFYLSTADPVKAKLNFINLSEEESKSRLLSVLEKVYENNTKRREEKQKWMVRAFYLLNVLTLVSMFLLFYPVIFRKGDDSDAGKPSISRAGTVRRTSPNRTISNKGLTGKPPGSATIRPKSLSGGHKNRGSADRDFMSRKTN